MHKKKGTLVQKKARGDNRAAQVAKATAERARRREAEAAERARTGKGGGTSTQQVPSSDSTGTAADTATSGSGSGGGGVPGRSTSAGQTRRRDKTQPHGKRKAKKSKVPAPAIDDDACQPPTTSAADTEALESKRNRKRKPEGDGGGRQRRLRAKKNEAAAAAAATASTTSSTTRTRTTRGTRRTTGGGGGGSSSGISPPASTTPTSPPSTASPVYPVTREDITSAIREQLATEQQARWDETTGGGSWTPRQKSVTKKDVQGQADISALKKEVTRRDAPKHAAGVGNVVFRAGVLWDTLTAKILAFPVSLGHFMGGPEQWEGENAAVVWRHVVYWLNEDGELIDGQCCTAHYLGEVMQRCGLDRVFVCDASGVAHPRAGSGLKKGNPNTKNLITAHVEYLLGSGRRILEVHSRGTTLRFLEVLEDMATAGHADVSIMIGSGKVRVHTFFDVPCGPDGDLDTVILFGTNHHSMMRFSFVANSIIRSQIAASALAGDPLNQAETDNLWAMSTTGSLSPEEWRDCFAVLLEELGPELLEKFESYVTKHDGDMDRAYQNLIGWKGGMAAPTTKAKRGGEWERRRDEAQEEVERLQAAPRTRDNRKALVEETVVVQDLSNALEKQYRLWERSVGAMHFGNATNYATYLEAKKTSQDANATLAQQEEASAVVATMEKEKTERLSAQGKKAGENSWTSQAAGKTVSGAAEKEAAAGQALSAAKTRAQKATAEEALESATAELAVVTEARQRNSDGGKADYPEGAALAGGGKSKGTRKGKAEGGRTGAKADLKPQTVARPEYRRMIAAGQEPDRRKVNKNAAERGSTKSTSEAKADGGKGKQGHKIASSGGSRGARTGRGPINDSSVMVSIGPFHRAYKITVGAKKGQVQISKGKSEFFRFRDVRGTDSNKWIIGKRRFDSHGSDKTLSYPADDKGNMVTGLEWDADPEKGLYHDHLVTYARKYLQKRG